MRPLIATLSFLLFFTSDVIAQKPPSFRALKYTSDGAIWASGTGGSVRVKDGAGKSFRSCTAPLDSAQLDFRGLHAWNARHAIVMSAGPGEASRLFETTDGCATWRPLAVNHEPQGFWDTLTFHSLEASQGAILGDPVNGRFTILRTTDGGASWTRDSSPDLATNPAGEGAFAASNSSLVFVPGTNDLVFGTGGLAGPRIFYYDSHSRTWTAKPLPVSEKNETTGVFSLHFRDTRHGVAVGGDYKRPDRSLDTLYLTSDGGRTWTPLSTQLRGYRSAIDYEFPRHRWVAAGPTGADESTDDGRTWHALDNGAWNTLSLPWGAGPNGRLAEIP